MNGLIYGEHNNFSLQFSSILGYRDFFSAYVEPVLLVRQNSGGLDDFDDTKLDLLKGYAMLTFWNIAARGRQGFHVVGAGGSWRYPHDQQRLLPWI